MKQSIKLNLTIFALIAMVVSVRSVEACVCSGSATPGGAYAEAEAVFIGTVQTTEKIPIPIAGKKDVFAEGQIAHVGVDRVFKNMDQNTVVFHTGGTDCDAQFKEGQQWLFYAYFDKKSKAWTIRACDRSDLVDGAADDLLFLKALPASSQKTRISGRLEHYEDLPNEGFKRIANLSGTRVRIIGSQKTTEIYTNGDGVYEVYGLPSGSYWIVPDVPTGLKIRFPIYYGNIDTSDRNKIELPEKGSAAVDFLFSRDK